MEHGNRTEGAHEAFKEFTNKELQEFDANYCECCKRQDNGCKWRSQLDPFWRPNGKIGCLRYKSALK